MTVTMNAMELIHADNLTPDQIMLGDLIFQAMPNLLSNILTIAELHITNKVKRFQRPR